ncbi:hypothetical protein TNCV_3516451 [Trichonephila clavipes]|nr:hypothetical protein TNCV_3516451 [Trichonephila clavipes]
MKKHHQDNNDNFNTYQNLVVTFNMYWVKIMLLQMPYPELIQFLKSTLRKLQKSKLLTKSCKKLLHNNSLKFKPSTLPSGKKNFGVTSQHKKLGLYIPQKFRLQIFQLIHGLAHPGIKSTVKLMTEKYVWSDIKKASQRMGKSLH